MFHDREDAGQQLAAMLSKRSFKRPLVLAIPKGGVVIGAILAQALGAELDVTLARKLRAPGQSELAFGAISESGHVYVNGDADEGPGVTDEYFHREKERQSAVIENCRQAVRSVRPKASIQGRSVIVADDGIATGSTMMAALQAIASHHPAEIIVAVPMAPQDRIHDLELHCTEVVCPLKVRNFWAVGQYYEDFPNIDDAQVIKLLRQFATQPV